MSRWILMSTVMVGIVAVLFGWSAVTYLAAGHIAHWLNGGPLPFTQIVLPEWTRIQPSVTIAIVNLVSLMLVGVMVIATALTLAERKWSAMMQDRVGPNRARFTILPGFKNLSLAGVPHVIADSVKMLTKEGFRPTAAARALFELAPIMNFAPIFCLFAIVPVGPVIPMTEVEIPTGLQVASPDFGILYIFALASIAVYGTALAGWASNNKFALLGGVRATSQMISYEVALGLSLVGMMLVCQTLKLDEIVAKQGTYLWSTNVGGVDIGLPAWGIFLQPLGFILFFTAAFAETKRAPFDLPEGESEVIGYFLEYSGMGFGLFMITEFVEVVVLSAITTAVFLGGFHIGSFEDFLAPHLGKWLAVLQATVFWVKVLALCYVQLAVRWSFPRFRYDQIQKLGWQMLLPAGLVNVFLSAALILWDPSMHALAVVGILELVVLGMMIPSGPKEEAGQEVGGAHAAVAAGHGHGGH